MGDEILKHIVKISLFMLLFCSLAMANEAYKNSIKEYDKFFREIGEKRVGVDEKIIDRVCEPYFTTKFESEGTGIGLYMSKMIIEKSMGGSFKIKNRDDWVVAIIIIGRNIIPQGKQ